MTILHFHALVQEGAQKRKSATVEKIGAVMRFPASVYYSSCVGTGDALATGGESRKRRPAMGGNW